MPATLQRATALPQQVQEIIAGRIRDRTYPQGGKIPPENQLAQEFQVSRATIRDAQRLLVAQGLLVRRQGAGTYVSSLAPIMNPLDRAIDFQALIASSGREPSVSYVYTALAEPSAQVAQVLELQEGEKVLESHKVFAADQKPMFFCVNSVPLSFMEPGLGDELLHDPRKLEPIYDFFDRHCGRRVEFHRSKVRAIQSREALFHGGLPLGDDEPVLLIDGVAYDNQTTPLFHTYEYHHHLDEGMVLEICRQRI